MGTRTTGEADGEEVAESIVERYRAKIARVKSEVKLVPAPEDAAAAPPAETENHEERADSKGGGAGGGDHSPVFAASALRSLAVNKYLLAGTRRAGGRGPSLAGHVKNTTVSEFREHFPRIKEAAAGGLEVTAIGDAVKKVAYRPGTSVNLIASSSRLKRRAVRGWKEEVLQSHIARSFEETLALQLQQFHSSEWKPGDLSCNLTPRSDEPQSDSLTVSPEVPLDSQQQTTSSGSKQNERQEDGHELCSPAVVDNHEQMSQDEVVPPNCTDVENENAEDRQTLFDLSISGSDPFAGLRSPALATVKSEQQLDFCGAGTAATEDGIPDLLMSPALVDRSDEFQFRNAASGGDDANYIAVHNFDFRGGRCVEKTSLLLSPDEQEAGRAAGTEVFSAESGRDRAGPEAQQVVARSFDNELAPRHHQPHSVDVVTVPLLFRQKVSERVLPASRHARHFTAPTAASKRRRSGGRAEGGGERGGVGCDPSVDDQGWCSSTSIDHGPKRAKSIFAAEKKANGNQPQQHGNFYSQHDPQQLHHATSGKIGSGFCSSSSSTFVAGSDHPRNPSGRRVTIAGCGGQTHCPATTSARLRNQHPSETGDTSLSAAEQSSILAVHSPRRVSPEPHRLSAPRGRPRSTSNQYASKPKLRDNRAQDEQPPLIAAPDLGEDRAPLIREGRKSRPASLLYRQRSLSSLSQVSDRSLKRAAHEGAAQLKQRSIRSAGVVYAGDVLAHMRAGPAPARGGRTAPGTLLGPAAKCNVLPRATSSAIAAVAATSCNSNTRKSFAPAPRTGGATDVDALVPAKKKRTTATPKLQMERISNLARPKSRALVTSPRIQPRDFQQLLREGLLSRGGATSAAEARDKSRRRTLPGRLQVPVRTAGTGGKLPPPKNGDESDAVDVKKHEDAASRRDEEHGDVGGAPRDYDSTARLRDQGSEELKSALQRVRALLPADLRKTSEADRVLRKIEVAAGAAPGSAPAEAMKTEKDQLQPVSSRSRGSAVDHETVAETEPLTPADTTSVDPTSCQQYKSTSSRPPATSSKPNYTASGKVNPYLAGVVQRTACGSTAAAQPSKIPAAPGLRSFSPRESPLSSGATSTRCGESPSEDGSVALYSGGRRVLLTSPATSSGFARWSGRGAADTIDSGRNCVNRSPAAPPPVENQHPAFLTPKINVDANADHQLCLRSYPESVGLKVDMCISGRGGETEAERPVCSTTSKTTSSDSSVKRSLYLPRAGDAVDESLADFVNEAGGGLGQLFRYVGSSCPRAGDVGAATNTYLYGENTETARLVRITFDAGAPRGLCVYPAGGGDVQRIEDFVRGKPTAAPVAADGCAARCAAREDSGQSGRRRSYVAQRCTGVQASVPVRATVCFSPNLTPPTSQLHSTPIITAKTSTTVGRAGVVRPAVEAASTALGTPASTSIGTSSASVAAAACSPRLAGAGTCKTDYNPLCTPPAAATARAQPDTVDVFSCYRSPFTTSPRGLAFPSKEKAVTCASLSPPLLVEPVTSSSQNVNVVVHSGTGTSTLASARLFQNSPRILEGTTGPGKDEGGCAPAAASSSRTTTSTSSRSPNVLRPPGVRFDSRSFRRASQQCRLRNKTFVFQPWLQRVGIQLVPGSPTLFSPSGEGTRKTCRKSYATVPM